jgi:hypothetical protein
MPTKSPTQTMPPQHQNRQPGLESEMNPKPNSVDRQYKGSGKLLGKVAIITGGDSGIGKAAAVCYAAEGADVVIVYLNEHSDAKETMRLIEKEGRRCLLIAGDVGDEAFCQEVVRKSIATFGKLDILLTTLLSSIHRNRLKILHRSSWKKRSVLIFSRIFILRRRLYLI